MFLMHSLPSRKRLLISPHSKDGFLRVGHAALLAGHDELIDHWTRIAVFQRFVSVTAVYWRSDASSMSYGKYKKTVMGSWFDRGVDPHGNSSICQKTSAG